MSNFASVCISSYNRPVLLECCLQSLWENTHYPHEIIVHDDGSRKETTDFLYAAMRAGKIGPLIMSPTDYNRGLGTSVNRAVDISEGKYIVKINGDDKFSPGWLRTGVRALEAFPEIGLLHLAYYDYTALWNLRYPDNPKASAIDYYTLHRETRDGITIRVVWCAPGDAFMWTRKLWNKVGPWDSGYNLSFGEDVDFRTRICSMGRNPVARPGYALCPPTIEELPAYWEKYKDTPWMAVLEPTVVDFSWGDGLSIVAEAQKTLRRGPLLHGGQE